MSKKFDFVGVKFGRLTVISLSKIIKKRTYWKCKTEKK